MKISAVLHASLIPSLLRKKMGTIHWTVLPSNTKLPIVVHFDDNIRNVDHISEILMIHQKF